MAISPLKQLAVKAETLFEAWQASALSSAYMQKALTRLVADMAAVEASAELAPQGWKAVWDRYEYDSTTCLFFSIVFDGG